MIKGAEVDINCAPLAPSVIEAVRDATRSCADLEQNGKNDAETICWTAVAIFDAYASWLPEPRFHSLCDAGKGSR